MTDITTIYNSIHAMMSTVFPAKMELSDPLIINNNDEATLANGYGIFLGSATNTNRTLCNYSIGREVTITLTKAFLGGHKSITIMDSTVISLLEELHNLIDYNYKNQIAGTDIYFNYVSDNGLERVFGESKTFFVIKASFQVEYIQSL